MSLRSSCDYSDKEGGGGRDSPLENRVQGGCFPVLGKKVQGSEGGYLCLFGTKVQCY